MRQAVLLLAFSVSLSALAADVAGRWNAVAKDPSGNEIKAELSLKQDGDKLAGTMGLPEASVELHDVQFKENVLTYKLEYNGMPVSVKMTLDGDKLTGNYNTDGGETGPIEAERIIEKAGDSASSIAGDWKVATKAPDGTPLKIVMTLKQDDGKWSGELSIEEFSMTVSLTDIKVDGENLSFNVPTDQGTYAVEAKVAGDKLEGSSKGPDGTKIKVTGTR